MTNEDIEKAWSVLGTISTAIREYLNPSDFSRPLADFPKVEQALQDIDQSVNWMDCQLADTALTVAKLRQLRNELTLLTSLLEQQIHDVACVRCDEQTAKIVAFLGTIRGYTVDAKQFIKSTAKRRAKSQGQYGRDIRELSQWLEAVNDVIKLIDVGDNINNVDFMTTPQSLDSLKAQLEHELRWYRRENCK